MFDLELSAAASLLAEDAMKKQPPVFLEDASEEVQREFMAHSILKEFGSGETLSLEGDSCHYFPIVLTGLVRVHVVGAGGQEVTLYRIQPGEGCVLTMCCMLKSERFPAFAAAEEESEVFLVPANVFRGWVGKYDFWREFAFNYLSRAITRVIERIEEVAFKKVDVRLMEFLLRHVEEEKSAVHMTHQELALELGTAREVVSRTLKGFEEDGLIRLGRKKIAILNIAELRSRARLL